MSGSHPDRNRRHLIGLGGLIAAGAGLAWLLRRTVPVGDDIGASTVARDVLADNSVPTVGPAHADLTMAIFTDYRCGACRAAYPALMRAVRNDGGVRLRIFDWPVFGPLSRRQAQIALAAARQGQYSVVHDQLMTDRRALDPATWESAVAESGADWLRLERDLARDAAAIDARLARTGRAALALGLPGTPAYLIGRYRVVGALDEAGFRRAFAQARSHPGYS